jgi:hypothetical protein
MIFLRIISNGFVLLAANWASIGLANFLFRHVINYSIVGLVIVMIFPIFGFWFGSALISLFSPNKLRLKSAKELALSFFTAPLLNPFLVIVVSLVSGATFSDLRNLWAVSFYQFFVNIMPVLIVKEKVYNNFDRPAPALSKGKP